MHLVAFVSSAPLSTASLWGSAVQNIRRHCVTAKAISLRHAKSMRLEGGPGSAPVPVSITHQPTAQKPPPATFATAVATGTAKAALKAWQTLLLAIMAGAYIGLGGILALRVGGAMPGIADANPGLHRLLFGMIGLPVGLTLVLAVGGELFTGNTMLMSAALFEGRIKPRSLALNWVLSFIGNLIGCLLLVKLVVATGVLSGAGSGAAAAVAIASAKTSLPFMQAFWRGLACNWFVCLAVYMANAAGDLASKFVAIILPISAFVAIGLEHSVANMFLIPMGMVAGAKVSIKAFLLKNLLPVTLGNIVAGVTLISLVYSLLYGKK